MSNLAPPNLDELKSERFYYKSKAENVEEMWRETIRELADAKEDAARGRELVRALKRGDCWCEMGVGNPSVKAHTGACNWARAWAEEGAGDE